MPTRVNNLKNSWLLYLCVGLALLPVLVFRDYTPSNELRYLSIADEALRNGTFFAFTNQGVPYADKPPLYFWIIMAGKALLGAHYMWFLSLFSLIPAFVITNVMARWTREEMDARYDVPARLLLLSCGFFLGAAVILRMDMLMCMFITLSLRVFWRMLKGEGNRRRNALLFPLYVFLALFTKGPVGILVPLLGVVAFLAVTRRISTLGRYWGWTTWGVLLAGCAVWFGLTYREGGSDYLNNLLFHQTIDRAVDAFHHEEPFYYYLVAVWYSMAPWSLLVVGVTVLGVCRRWRATELQKFFLTIVVVVFVMLSLISSKIQIYLLPAFPFFVYLCMMWLPRLSWKLPAWLLALPALVLALGLPGLWVAARLPETAYLGQPLFFAGAAVLSVAGLCTLGLLFRKHDVGRAVSCAAAGLFLAIFVGGWALPKVNAWMGYGELCRKAAAVGSSEGLQRYCVYGISRPESMDVYLHQDVCPVSEEEIVSGRLQEAVLMLPTRKLEKLKAVWTPDNVESVGDYSIVVL